MIYIYKNTLFPCTVVTGRPDRYGWLLIRNNNTGLLSWADPQYLKEN